MKIRSPYTLLFSFSFQDAHKNVLNYFVLFSYNKTIIIIAVVVIFISNTFTEKIYYAIK